MSDELREIPLSEVEQHKNAASCWFVMNDKVYDVTSFLSEHPGGFQVLLEVAGKDATSSFEDVGHSKDAREMAKEYVIGKLHPDSVGSASTAKKSDALDSSKKSFGCKHIKEIICSSTWTNFLIPTTIGIIIYILYKGAIKGFS